MVYVTGSTASAEGLGAARETELERDAAYLAGWRPFFHAVATVAELDAPRLDEFGRQQPLAAELLGQRLVLARLNGELVALDGTCPHRGAGLHIGWIADDRSALVCRYHGAEWCADGGLRSLPAMTAAGHQTPDWRIGHYPVQERFGLIWVCLEEQPRLPLLEFPEAEDPDFVHIPIAAETWNAGVGRMIEAALDTYHFAFTHRGTIGDPNDPRAPRPDVRNEGNVLCMEYAVEQPAHAGIVAEDRAITGTVTVRYRMTAAPNAVRLVKASAAGEYVIYLTSAPLGLRRSHWYRMVARNHDKATPAAVYTELEDAINRQDQMVVESMLPWQSPTDLDDERHVVMDRPTVAYRRWMSSLGSRCT
jgi:vanillate O-demethylase monooxygenase subunit